MSSMEGDTTTAETSAEREEEAPGEKAKSLEEMGKYRSAAQQNSIDAIRAAEERYAVAVGHGLGAAAAYTVAKGVEAKDALARGVRAAAGKAKDAATSTGESAAEPATEVKGATEANRAKGSTTGGSEPAASRRAEEDRGTSGGHAQKGGQQKAAHDGIEKAEEETEIEVHDVHGEEANKTAEKLRGLSVGEEQPEMEAERCGARTGSYKGEGHEVLHEPGYLAKGGTRAASSVGGLFEAVGEAVIGIAQSARKLIMGREPRQRGQ